MKGRVLLLALIALVPLLAAAAPPAGSVNEDTVREIAAQLRCVVCQNLSVADSPSEMANQMRGIIRERLQAADTPEQVVAYFVEKYGEWILLSPPPRGFNLLVWTLPFVGIGVGLVAVLLLARRWSHRTARLPLPETIDPAMRERIEREMAELEP
ncbi:MAG: cytochrome c-type biogenesis protein CcmH [Candidatus Rokubacteria bacterium]|nr:cytochrome c-type biogenesis protein CcmH [Candidatus Rokubacteria bacterium]